MSLVVVLLVAGAVFIYVRASRKARAQWLRTLDLPGQWQWDQGDGELTLNGGPKQGTFVRREVQDESSGAWAIVGNQIVLKGPNYQQALDIHFIKAGNLGLEDEQGLRRIYVKESTNVVPLKRD